MKSVLLSGVAGMVLATGAQAAAVDAKIVDMQRATLVAPEVGTSRVIGVDIVLASRDQKGLDAFVAGVSNRKSSSYRQYLTPDEFEARFGADPAAFASVMGWARSQGLSVRRTARNHRVLSFAGSPTQIERAFSTKISMYADESGRSFYAASVRPSVPDAITPLVKGILGLSDQDRGHPLFRRGRVLGKTIPAPQALAFPGSAAAGLPTGSGPGGAFIASDLRTAYRSGEHGGGVTETAAVFEQGGFYPADVSKYLAYNKLPFAPVTLRKVNGYGGLVNDPDVEVEAVLDIDMAIGLNPKLKRVMVYEDGDDAFQVALVDSFSAMAQDDVAKTVSISYGLDEALQGGAAIAAENAVLEQMAAEGITVAISSGDSGAYGNEAGALHVSDPASQPYALAVGGTRLVTKADQSYGHEITWNDLKQGYGAGGGGVSAVWPIPAYQLALGASAVTANGGSATMRNVPDVSGVADPLYGVLVYTTFGGWITIGGTSVSAPVWNGVLSAMNADSAVVGQAPLGFVTPDFYELGQYALGATTNDVVKGTNGLYIAGQEPAGYSAGVGYDNVTGWGSPIGDGLEAIVLQSAPLLGAPPAMPTQFTASHTATMISASVKAVSGASGYEWYAYEVNPLTGNSTPVPSAFAVTTAPTTVLSGLVAGKVYYLEVAAADANGVGPFNSAYIKTSKQ